MAYQITDRELRQLKRDAERERETLKAVQEELRLEQKLLREHIDLEERNKGDKITHTVSEEPVPRRDRIEESKSYTQEESNITNTYEEFMKTLDKYDKSSTRTESQTEESANLSEHMKQLQHRLESLQEENDFLKSKTTPPEILPETAFRSGRAENPIENKGKKMFKAFDGDDRGDTLLKKKTTTEEKDRTRLEYTHFRGQSLPLKKTPMEETYRSIESQIMNPMDSDNEQRSFTDFPKDKEEWQIRARSQEKEGNRGDSSRPHLVGSDRVSSYRSMLSFPEEKQHKTRFLLEKNIIKRSEPRLQEKDGQTRSEEWRFKVKPDIVDQDMRAESTQPPLKSESDRKKYYSDLSRYPDNMDLRVQERDTRTELRLKLEKEESRYDAMLAEGNIAMQKLLEKERLLDERYQRKHEEEKLIEERLKLIELKAEKLAQQRERRKIIEQRIKDKEKENEAYEMKLKALRQREEDLSKLCSYSDISEKVHIKEEESSYRQQEGDNLKKSDNSGDRSTLTQREERDRYYGKPQAPPFDGTSFEEWKLEVTCLLKSSLYPEHLITQSVRNSLKGHTRKVLLTLGEQVSAQSIVKKLEDIYGRVETEDTDWQDFFTATQKEGEVSSTWAIRLESLLQFATKGEDLPEGRKNKMLKSRFWKGLRNEALKTATRVSYESEDSFEKLRSKVRKEEKEIAIDRVNKGTGKVSSIEGSPKENEQLQVMKQLLDRMKKLEEELHRQHVKSDEHQRQFGGNRRNRFNRNDRNLYEQNRPWRQRQIDDNRQEEQPRQHGAVKKDQERKPDNKPSHLSH